MKGYPCFFEKIYLHFRGKRDAKKNLFFQHTFGNSLEDTFRPPNIKSVFVSSYIMTEQSRLKVQSYSLLRKSLCLLYYPGEKYAKPMGVGKAISTCESEIRNLQEKGRNIKRENEKEKNALLKIQEKAKLSGVENYIMLYENKILELEKKQLVLLAGLNQNIIFFLNEKIRILEKLQIRLIEIEAKSCCKISYYYEKAGGQLAHEKNVLPYFIMNSEYGIIFGNDALIECRKIITEAKELKACIGSDDEMSASSDATETEYTEKYETKEDFSDL